MIHFSRRMFNRLLQSVQHLSEITLAEIISLLIWCLMCGRVSILGTYSMGKPTEVDKTVLFNIQRGLQTQKYYSLVIT